MSLFIVNSFLFCDASVPFQQGFQDPATPVAEGILRFHHDLMFILILVVVFVFWILFVCLHYFKVCTFYSAASTVHGTFIEVVWTLIPAFILIVVAVPSFAQLYSVDEVVNPALTLKVVGHQWYWTYEYSDFFDFGSKESLVFDSYMILEEEQVEGDLRLLEVDNRLVLPVGLYIRLIVTAADVLHCWTVPSFGLKIDACPGRLNQASLFQRRGGQFFGQCSEICGINHGFIPIVVQAVSLEKFLSWVLVKQEEA